MKKILTTIVVLVLLVGCSNNTSKNSNESKSLEYSIIKDDSKRDIKRVVQIMLKDYINETTLKKIALEVKSNCPKSYQRTFIGYFVENENKDLGYWATTNFNPTLKINIIGLTVEEKAILMNKPKSTLDKKVLGSWIDNQSSMLINRVTLFTLDKKLYLEKIYADGSGEKKLVMKEKDKKGLLKIIFKDKKKQYYLINKKNELEFWNDKGHYYTAKSI
jgi:hypothetical protein